MGAARRDYPRQRTEGPSPADERPQAAADEQLRRLRAPTTCTAFAVKLIDGEKGVEDCPALTSDEGQDSAAALRQMGLASKCTLKSFSVRFRGMRTGRFRRAS